MTGELDPVDALMNDLREFCRDPESGRGRASEIAATLGVSRSVVSDWINTDSVPSLRLGLKLQAYLKRHRRRRPSK